MTPPVTTTFDPRRTAIDLEVKPNMEAKSKAKSNGKTFFESVLGFFLCNKKSLIATPQNNDNQRNISSPGVRGNHLNDGGPPQPRSVNSPLNDVNHNTPGHEQIWRELLSQEESETIDPSNTLQKRSDEDIAIEELEELIRYDRDLKQAFFTHMRKLDLPMIRSLTKDIRNQLSKIRSAEVKERLCEKLHEAVRDAYSRQSFSKKFRIECDSDFSNALRSLKDLLKTQSQWRLDALPDGN